jgi:PAS domain S-box-containing protein
MARPPTYQKLAARVRELEKAGLVSNHREMPINEQTDFLKLLLESLPHPLYVIDASNYRITATNLASQLGIISEDSTCYALIHKRDTPCDPAEHPCPVKEIKKTKKPVSLEHLHFDRDGNATNVQVYAYPIFDTAGNVSQIIEYALDITERKRVVEALWESEAQYRRLVENMNDGLAIRDANGLFTYANSRFLEIIGFPKDEVVGHAVTDFLDETNQRILEDQIALRRNGERKQYELIWNSKDGRKIPTIVSPEPIIDRDGQFKGSFAVVTEITRLKQMEETLRKSEEEHRMLVETMSDKRGSMPMKGYVRCWDMNKRKLLVFRRKKFSMRLTRSFLGRNSPKEEKAIRNPTKSHSREKMDERCQPSFHQRQFLMKMAISKPVLP